MLPPLSLCGCKGLRWCGRATKVQMQMGGGSSDGSSNVKRHVHPAMRCCSSVSVNRTASTAEPCTACLLLNPPRQPAWSWVPSSSCTARLSRPATQSCNSIMIRNGSTSIGQQRCLLSGRVEHQACVLPALLYEYNNRTCSSQLCCLHFNTWTALHTGRTTLQSTTTLHHHIPPPSPPPTPIHHIPAPSYLLSLLLSMV